MYSSMMDISSISNYNPGAAANRVASEACVQARNEGRDLSREGGDVIREACWRNRSSSNKRHY